MNNPIDLNTANTMFNEYPDVGNPAIIRFLFVCERAFWWFLLRLQDGDTRSGKTLNPLSCARTLPFG